jgi:glycosyltransferase involved in cell wall biosynthesis
MRILFILPHSLGAFLPSVNFLTFDGYVDSYCAHVMKLGHQPTLVFLSSTVAKPKTGMHVNGYRVYVMPCSPRLKFPAEFSGSLVGSLWRIIEWEGIDVVHIHSYYLAMYEILAILTKLKRRPFVTQFHGYSDPVRRVFQLHAHLPRAARVIRFVSLLVSLRLAARILVPSRLEEKQLTSHFKIRKRSIAYFQTGVDTTVFRPMDKSFCKSQVGINSDSSILFVGRLSREKGLKCVIEALSIVKRRFSDANLLMVGEGPQRRDLMSLADSLGLAGSVRWFGWVDNRALPQIYNAADVFVLASRTEAQGVSILEAMACRTPVIASSVGGLPDLINHLQNGLLVPPGDARELAKAISSLLSDANLRNCVAANGYACVTATHAWDIRIGELVNIYSEVCLQHGNSE